VPGQKAPERSRRAQIVRAGHHVAARVGLEKLTVRLVAAKAKLSTGLVHFYFKTRERLLAAVLGDVLETTMVLPPTEVAAQIKPPLAQLRTMVRGEVVRVSGKPGRMRLFLEYCVKGFRDRPIGVRVRAEFRRYRAAFLPTAKAVVAAEPERFRNVSASGLASVAAGIVEGGAVQSAVDPATFDVDEYARAAKGLLQAPGKAAP
jgi:TetR/AcrR family transcriptional regulator, transcriptional repressor of bet genes